MDNFLYWYSQNNKIIIQSLILFIGIILIYFIYRLFFHAADSVSENGELHANNTSQQIAELDKKISKIIDFHEKNPIQKVVSNETQDSETQNKIDIPEGVPAENQELVLQLQAELEKTKKELKNSNELVAAKSAELNTAKEKILEYQKNAPLEKESVPEKVNTEGSSGDAQLLAKIEDLQRKLQEYDIISDDIAELQVLRAENSELKAKLAQVTGVST